MHFLAVTGFQWWNEGVGVISTEERYISMLSEVRTISYLADLTAAFFTSITDPLDKIMFIDAVRGDYIPFMVRHGCF